MPFAGYANFAACVKANSSKSDPQAYCATVMRATEGVRVWEADVSPTRRRALAGKGYALPDGSYPIPNVSFLRRAIQAIGRAKNPAAAKAHIIKRARALKRTDLLPSDWTGSTAKEGVALPSTMNDSLVVDASEAVFNKDEETGKMTAQVTIIKAGRAKNPRNYRSSAIKKAAKEGIYNGMRMFVNHSDKPPIKRSLNELVSAVESTEYNPKKDSVDGTVVFFDEKFFDYAQRAHEHMGVSANHRIRTHLVREGASMVQDVEEIVGAHSVDWVAYPSAGGEVISFAKESEGVDDVEWADITADQLKENAPELYAQLTAHESDDDQDDGDKDEPVTMSRADIAQLVKESIEATQKASAEDAAKKAAAQKKVHEYLSKAGLPARTAARVEGSFANVLEYVESDVKEAVDEANAELKEAGAGPRIKGEGPSSQGGSSSSKSYSAREGVESIFGIKKEPVKSGKES